MAPAETTLEHLVPRLFGGPTNKKNLVLAHWRCNKQVNVKSAHEKIEIHVQARLAAAARAPTVVHIEIGR